LALGFVTDHDHCDILIASPKTAAQKTHGLKFFLWGHLDTIGHEARRASIGQIDSLLYLIRG